MSVLPGNLGRVPNVLASMLALRNLSQTNMSLLRVQGQMASQQRVERPSDDPVAASIIGVLDAELEQAGQRSRNLSHATSVLATVDSALGQLSELVLESKTIASSQVGVGSDTQTRLNQAVVISSHIRELLGSVNSRYADLSLFAGGKTASPAFVEFHGGFRFMGDTDGLRTDLGDEIDFPITLSGDVPVGALSARVIGDVDLNPILTPDTYLSDLRGPMEGIDRLGSMQITIDNGTLPVTIEVDLSEAETIGDVEDMIESAIRAADPAALGGSFPNGVFLTNERLAISITNPAYSITFDDGTAGFSATALGLASFVYDSANSVNTASNTDLDPKVTNRTLLGDMNPGTALVYGDIVFRNGGRSGTITTAATMTVGELKEALQQLDLGARLEVGDDGNTLAVINEVAGLRLSIEEAGSLAATTLGIRNFKATTPLSEFNDGRGVHIADGIIDESTGLPDPDLNIDFEIELTDGFTFTVDLTPADIVTVQTVIDRINAQAVTAGLTIGTGPGEFQAGLAANGNGIVLSDNRGGTGTTQVRSLHGYAAEDLGLLDGTFTAGTPATLTGEDRATIRVDSLFSTLIELRDALENDETLGITFAGERLEEDLERLSTARALVGARSQRIESAAKRLEDQTVMNEGLRSELKDLDFFEATSRLSLLQLQLQAGIQAIVQTRPLTLLNFLG